VIRALANHEKYVRILTRNPMLASSYMDVFQKTNEYVTIGSSIPTLDEAHINAIEPDAPPVESRFRGLKRFAEAGVQTYISMSPTYPTIQNEDDMRTLLAQIATVGPEVVFHEPINPRGKNFQMTLDAAWAAGCDDLGSALAKIRDEESWHRYACTHFAWVTRLGRELDLPVHLWPDKQLVENAAPPERSWLQRWRDRQSPEAFAGRITPGEPMPSPPPLFSWEQNEQLEDYG
jgi:hypothetical protein